MEKRYLVEMKGYGRVSVFYIDADTPAQARFEAKKKHGIEIRVTEQRPPELAGVEETRDWS
jgi:hypothetical protein